MTTQQTAINWLLAQISQTAEDRNVASLNKRSTALVMALDDYGYQCKAELLTIRQMSTAQAHTYIYASAPDLLAMMGLKAPMPAPSGATITLSALPTETRHNRLIALIRSAFTPAQTTNQQLSLF